MAPKLATLPKSTTDVEPRQMPNWDDGSRPTVLPDARWEHATPPAALPRAPDADAPQQGRARRSHSFTVRAVLATLLVVFVAVTSVLIALRHSGTQPTGGASTVTFVPSGIARIEAATHALNLETSTTRTNLHALDGIPTPQSVGQVINPYVQSLQRYGSELATVHLPPGPRTAANLTHALVTQNLQHLETIDGLPALRLGTYLEQFTHDAAALQNAFSNLQEVLRTSSP